MRKRSVKDLRRGAQRVLTRVELDQVYAVTSSYRTRDGTQEPPFRTETQLRVMADNVEGGIEVRAKYVTDAYKDLADNETKGVWQAELELVATFENVTDDDAEFAEDDLEAFAVLVGTPALHPYAREYTQMLTSHSQYPAFTLGLLNSIADLPQEHEIEFPTRTDEEADASPHRPQSDTRTAPTTC